MSETIINLTAGNLGSAVVNVTTGKGSTKYDLDFGKEFRTKYSVNFGDRGPTGPNEITTATATNLTGFIYGDGTNVAGAQAASTWTDPNTLAQRDEFGNLYCQVLTATSNLVLNEPNYLGSHIFSSLATSTLHINIPDASGYVALTTNATGSASNIEIYAKAATTLAKGAVVYVSGASGANKLISPAQASTEGLSSKTIGVTIQALATNAFGYVMTEGDLTGLGINLGHGHGVVEGDPIWLSPDTAGGMVFGLSNKPSAPYHMVFVGYVTRINGNTLDSIYVKIQNGFELQELHNVAISNPQNNQTITYDTSLNLWVNKSNSFAAITEQLWSSSSQNYLTIATLTLPVGVWNFDAIASMFGSTTGNMRTRISSNANIRVGLMDYYGAANAVTNGVSIVSDAINSIERENTTTIQFRRHLTGVIEVYVGTTEIYLQIAQITTDPANSVSARKRSHMMARRIE